jgi:hypothetical protein
MDSEDDATILMRCGCLMLVFTAVVAFMAWGVFELVTILANG